MAHVVLRQRARVFPNLGYECFSVDSEQHGVVVMDDSSDFLVGVLHDFQIGGAADETGHGDCTVRSAAAKQGRIPDGSEGPNLLPARNQKTEAIEWVENLLSFVSRRDDGDRSVRVARQGRRQVW